MNEAVKIAGLRLRSANNADAEAITRLVNDAFRLERLVFTTEDRTNPDDVRNMLRKGEFLLTEEGAALVGCVYVEPRGERGYIGLLSVDPSRRRSGLGTWLMKAAEDCCRATGARGVDVQLVNLRKELPDYYHRLGYVETGTAPFPEHVKTTQPCHFIRMSKEFA
jgi:N-acetylglutamate synthase-like GNAT family acetyltransferase